MVRPGHTRGGAGVVLPPREKQAGAFREIPGLAPMLAAALLARTGATMVGLSMGFVAYEQTASAFTVAFVAASFGLAFAAGRLEAEALAHHRPDAIRDDLRLVVPVEHDPAPIRTQCAVGLPHRVVELGAGPLQPIAGPGTP
jgi:hypothetical protein